MRLRIRVPLLYEPRGELSLVGVPTWKDPAIAIRVALQVPDPLPETCQARLWIDGVESQVPRQQRESAASLRLAVSSEQLAQLGRASGSALSVCGHLVELDIGARGRIKLFAQRFADARTRLLPAAMAASEAKAQALQ